jgi:hypothetical protein
MEKNVAFSTLLLLVLATPGYFFLLTFNAGRLNKNVLPKEWIQDVLRMIFYSFPFHILALFAVAHIIPPEWVKPHEVSADVFHLLVGTSTNTTITPLYDRLYSAIHWIIAYFFAVIVIAALVGYVSRWAVWEGRLDVKFETLRYNNNWLYFFTGRDRVPSLQHGFHDLLQAIQLACGWLHPKYRIASIVDVLVEVEGVSRIYRGFIEGSFTTFQRTALETRCRYPYWRRGPFYLRIGRFRYRRGQTFQAKCLRFDLRK